MTPRRSLLAVLLLALFATVASAQTYTARVVRVADGDTITVVDGTTKFRVRLAEIDCPELNQAWGIEAKQFTTEMVFGHVVTVVSEGQDRYGRVIGHVRTEQGDDLNSELVRAGLAWHYKRYSNSRSLADLETSAHREHRGLWADPNPTPPWEWRRYHPER